MGYSPQQVDEMSIFQWLSAVDGYVQANSPDDGSLSKSEADDLWSWMQEKGAR